MSIEYREALRSISKERNIPFEELLLLLERALTKMYKRSVAVGANGERLSIRTEVGERDIHIYCMKKVVRFVDDQNSEISLSDALKKDPGAKEGDVIEVEVTPSNFGRLAAQTAKQVLEQNIDDYERDKIVKQYKSRIGTVINTHVARYDGDLIYLEPDGNRDDIAPVEALLPPNEQVPGESLRVREMVKAYVLAVRPKAKGRFNEMIVSRTHPSFIRCLFETEVEEVAAGIVKIVKVAREQGARTKVVVRSEDPNVDAIGACLGPMGSRIQAVTKELRGEKVDVILYSEDPAELIRQCVAPARVISAECHPETKSAEVVVPAKETSLAIGKNGVNARLTARITGWKIDIKGNNKTAKK
ncbi:MAG: transcription termination/antitermination protein NusA [Abditibacteriota bacterium]|nr:transcription termination/antitermination protein NusA [Abditibacteriota bacterium]